MQPLLTQRQASEMLALSERTVERLRCSGLGPKFVRCVVDQFDTALLILRSGSHLGLLDRPQNVPPRKGRELFLIVKSTRCADVRRETKAMSTTPAVPAASEAELVTKIKDQLKLMDQTANQIKQTVLNQALVLGELLLQAKARMDHGKFGKWLEKHSLISERSAQRYMALKEQWPKIEAWMKAHSGGFKFEESGEDNHVGQQQQQQQQPWWFWR